MLVVWIKPGPLRVVGCCDNLRQHEVELPSDGRHRLGILLRADDMLELIATFLAGLVCGIIIGRVYLWRQRKKIEFYESYIHRRLHDTMPHATNDPMLRKVEKTQSETDYFRQGQS